MSAVPLEPYATLDAAGIPRHVLGERFAAVCERLEDTAPAWATESDIYRKAGFYLDDRGSLDWEDEDMCELPGTEMARATDAKVSAFDGINAVFAPPTSGVFGDVANIFDAAIKREHEKQAKYQTKPKNNEREAAK